MRKTPKWGKLTDEEIKLKEVSFDSTASAVVLFSKGELSYHNSNFSIDKHVRIKILKKEGSDFGNIVIPYYSHKGLESVKKIKGQTHEILPDGRIITHEIDKKEVFDVAINEYWNEIRFPLPAIKPGTIIEYSYTLYTTNFTFLDAWVFQDEIPTLYSSFKAEIPHFLSYVSLLQGNRIYQKYKDSDGVNHWELENIPALKAEPFTYNLQDYAEKIQFQLSSYKTRDGYGYESEKKVFTDWKAISTEILTHEKIKPYLKSNKVLKELNSFPDPEGKGLEKAKNIYFYVQKNFIWNENHGLIPDTHWKDFVEERKGNGASINLILLSLLQDAGFRAYPLAISTKQHGYLNKNIPFASQFNHLIVCLKSNENTFLLDAAGNPFAFGILPVKDLNGKGLVLGDQAEWIDIKDQSNSSTFLSTFINLSKGTYTCEALWSGYPAYEAAKKLSDKSYHNLFLSSSSTMLPDSSLLYDSLSTKNTLKSKAYFSEKDWSSFSEPIVYYKLIMPQELKENPLKLEKRNLPLDFGHRFRKFYHYEISIPAGYQVEELPKPMMLVTPDKEAIFAYHAETKGKKISIQVRLEVKSSLFSVQQYPYLREFFDKAINHCQQAIVLAQ